MKDMSASRRICISGASEVYLSTTAMIHCFKFRRGKGGGVGDRRIVKKKERWEWEWRKRKYRNEENDKKERYEKKDSDEKDITKGGRKKDR